MGGRSLALAVLAACSARSSGPVPTPAPARAGSAVPVSAGSAAPVAQPVAAPHAPARDVDTATLAEVGLEAASLDRSVDPCVDFYQFACGGWLAKTQIPADRALSARFYEIDDKNKAALKGLLEGATGTLGDFYASCLDAAAIDKAGTSALKPLLDRTMKVGSAKSWLAALTALHGVGIQVVFSWSVDPDLEASTTNVTMLDAGRLGLRDRDYYLKPDHKDLLAAYQQHVGRMLALAGVAKPEAAAADVIAIETELAKLTKTPTQMRAVKAANNPSSLERLAKQTRSIDWKTYYKALGAAPSKKMLIGTPAFFSGLDGVRKRIAPARWAGYFTYHLLARTAHALPKAFDDEAFALARIVTGVTEQRPRDKRCIDATTTALGELLGRAYAEKHFPPDARQTTSTLVDAIAAVMHDEIDKVDWMSEATRRTAQAKLGKLVRMIGYPDTWRSYQVEVKRDDFAGNVLRAAAFETKRVLGKAGKPVDRREWYANTFTVDAFYNPSANHTVLPAGILQPPFFGANRSIAANLGGIGMVIGHELTHAFDDQGAQFDADGNLTNWWQPDDKAKFEAKGKCLADMYSSFEALPKHFVIGELTLGENIADLGGVKMAFKAYRSLRKDSVSTVIADGFTEDQQFFIAVGQAWCTKMRPAEAQRRLIGDTHAPPKFRVFGALRNLPEFSDAFQCAPGTPMHPAQTCSVW